MTDITHGWLLAAETSARTITGIVAPYGVSGNTSIGAWKLRAGSIRLPEPLSRIKLLAGHDRDLPVGYAVAANDTPAGLEMTFKIANTPAGDAALVEAAELIRDAFSVEMNNLTTEGDEITAGDLVAVAQLAVPAYSDARVTSVAAQHKGDDMTETSPEVTPETGPDTETETETERETERETATERPVRAAARPAGLSAGAAPAKTMRGLPDLYGAMVAMATDGPMTPEMRAALADITHTANAWVQPTQFENQLWSGVNYSRRIVPLMTNKNLTSYKVTGWRWKIKPEVDDYAGDKTEVPTNPAVTEAAETTALRLAGAHDIDRKFRDFGDTHFFQAYYEAMAESWAIKSDTRAADFLVSNATAVTGTPPVTDLLDAVEIGAQAVEDNTNTKATFALVNPGDWRTYVTGMTRNDVPAFIDLLDFQPGQFVRSNLVPAGAVIVGARGAVTWYERSGSPIRVETVDLAKGGIDGGVFGYYATLLNAAGGLVSVALPATEPPAAARTSK